MVAVAKIQSWIFIGAIAVLSFGCGDNDDDGGSSSIELGTQIDRAGRAGMNRFLIASFDAENGDQETAKDTYNGAEQAQWGSFVDDFEETLAVYDGVDRDCTNGFYNEGNNTAGTYENFATALADDRLYLNAALSTCEVYLAIEINIVNESGIEDCGGRTPTMNVTNTTYSMLVNGEDLDLYDDGLTEGDDEHSLTSFPYLAGP